MTGASGPRAPTVNKKQADQLAEAKARSVKHISHKASLMRPDTQIKDATSALTFSQGQSSLPMYLKGYQ